MPWTSEHTKWLKDTGRRLKTADGKIVEVWEFQYENDEKVLKKWAKHFRNHYCLDTEIDKVKPQHQTRSEYLQELIFPDQQPPGPSVRAGDFGEILIADFLQWILKFTVPRVRWCSKVRKNESAKGSDVIGFKHNPSKGAIPEDALAVFESKTKFSQSTRNCLQQAVNDSAKDNTRLAESLNFIKRQLSKQKQDQIKLVERFQNPVDYPHEKICGAAALYSTEHFKELEIKETNTSKISETSFPHPDRENLQLVVITGIDMMALVHELYRRAADEA